MVEQENLIRSQEHLRPSPSTPADRLFRAFVLEFAERINEADDAYAESQKAESHLLAPDL
jgi:hypothetical protein